MEEEQSDEEYEEEPEEKTTFLLDTKRLIIFGIVMVIIFSMIWLLLYLKADEVTKDPCSVCAKRMGEEVRCVVGETIPVTRTYDPNGSIRDDSAEVIASARRAGTNYSNFTINESLFEE